MDQNIYALIVNSFCRYAPLRVTVSALWKKFGMTQAIWGGQELMVPINQSTGQLTYDRESMKLAEQEILFDKYPIRKIKTGQRISVESIEAFDAASRKGMGISPFFNGVMNIGILLSKGLERWTYIGDDANSVDMQAVRGFLNSKNTTRIRTSAAASGMDGLTFYKAIVDAHSQLIMNIGNANLYSAGGGSISIAIPARYQPLLNQLVTIPGGGPLPVKVSELIKSLDMVDRVAIVDNAHVAAPSGTTTESGTAFAANELCIFIGFNNPAICGVGVDMLESQEARSRVSRLLDESGRDVSAAEMTIADEVAKEVKTKVYDEIKSTGPDAAADKAKIAEIIDNNILSSLNALSADYQGVAPDNIVNYYFEGWLKTFLNGTFTYVGGGSIYTAGGIVSTPGMMIAMGCQDTL